MKCSFAAHTQLHLLYGPLTWLLFRYFHPNRQKSFASTHCSTTSTMFYFLFFHHFIRTYILTLKCFVLANTIMFNAYYLLSTLAKFLLHQRTLKIHLHSLVTPLSHSNVFMGRCYRQHIHTYKKKHTHKFTRVVFVHMLNFCKKSYFQAL